MPKPLTTSPLRKHALTLTLLLLLSSGCAHNWPAMPSLPVDAPAIPPLSSTARQPSLPPECSPSCLAGLTRERDSWLLSLMPPAAPASSASGNTTR